MNFLELCQTLRREAGISGTGPASVENQSGEMRRVVEWVREANTEIQKMPYNWDFLWSEYSLVLTEVEPGVFVQDYDLADLSIKTPDLNSFYASATADPTQKWIVSHLPHINWRRRYGGIVSTETGKVTTVTIKPNRVMRFEPAPDQLYTITFDYFMEPQRLLANTDVPLIPIDFHGIIIQKALMEYARYENAPEVYQGANTEFTRMLDDLKKQHIMDTVMRQRPLV